MRAARQDARRIATAAAAEEGKTDEEIEEAGDDAADNAGSNASNEANRHATKGLTIKADVKGSKLTGDMEVIPEFRRAEVLVATPARLLKMMQDGWVMPGRLKHVVVDEADEMLSRGFEKEVSAVIDFAYQENGTDKT